MFRKSWKLEISKDVVAMISLINWKGTSCVVGPVILATFSIDGSGSITNSSADVEIDAWYIAGGIAGELKGVSSTYIVSGTVKGYVGVYKETKTLNIPNFIGLKPLMDKDLKPAKNFDFNF